MLLFILHLLLLLIFAHLGFSKLYLPSKEKLSKLENSIFFIEAGEGAEIWKKAQHIWAEFSRVWRYILWIWIVLYSWFLLNKGITAIDGIGIPNWINLCVFNFLNNIETVLIIVSLSYIVKGWRSNNELTIGPFFYITIVIATMVVDILLKIMKQNFEFDYSFLTDLTSGIFTGLFFGIFVSKLHSRFINFPNTLIVILFFYCCLMTVYPLLNRILLNLENLEPFLLSINNEEDRILLDLVIKKYTKLLHGLNLFIFFIALTGKVIIISLFYFEEYSLKFFLYIKSIVKLENKYVEANEHLLQEFNS